MEELGADSAALHRRLGRSLRLRPGDRLLAVGDQADEVCAGVVDQGVPGAQVSAVASLEPVAECLAAWPGAVFLKGSRRHRLESLLAAAPALARLRRTEDLSMLSNFAQYSRYFGPLRLLQYLTVRTMLATVTAAFIGFLAGPALIRRFRALKFGRAYADGRTGGMGDQFDKKTTPPMGGLIIFLAVFVSSVLWAAPNVWVFVSLFVYAVLTYAGWRDDYLKIVARTTMASPRGRRSRGSRSPRSSPWAFALASGQLGENSRALGAVHQARRRRADAVVAAPRAGLFLDRGFQQRHQPHRRPRRPGRWLHHHGRARLWHHGLSRRQLRATIYLGISHVPGTGELAVICGALIGGTLAFLWFNAYPAEVFMGDTGSLALGGLIGVMAFMIHQPFTLVIVGGVFVMEALSVIIQVGCFKVTRRRTGTAAAFFSWHPSIITFKSWAGRRPKWYSVFGSFRSCAPSAGLGTLKLR